MPSKIVPVMNPSNQVEIRMPPFLLDFLSVQKINNVRLENGLISQIKEEDNDRYVSVSGAREFWPDYSTADNSKTLAEKLEEHKDILSMCLSSNMQRLYTYIVYKKYSSENYVHMNDPWVVIDLEEYADFCGIDKQRAKGGNAQRAFERSVFRTIDKLESTRTDLDAAEAGANVPLIAEHAKHKYSHRIAVTFGPIVNNALNNCRMRLHLPKEAMMMVSGKDVPYYRTFIAVMKKYGMKSNMVKNENEIIKNDTLVRSIPITLSSNTWRQTTLEVIKDALDRMIDNGTLESYEFLGKDKQPMRTYKNYKNLEDFKAGYVAFHPTSKNELMYVES